MGLAISKLNKYWQMFAVQIYASGCVNMNFSGPSMATEKTN